MELRLVVRHRLQSTTRYEACYDNNSHSHQVCTICGKVMELKSPLVAKVVQQVQTKRFRKDGFSLYIYGVCSTCQAKMTRLSKAEQSKKQK
jgi:Fur family ferric uptake transcriptional regulator